MWQSYLFPGLSAATPFIGRRITTSAAAMVGVFAGRGQHVGIPGFFTGGASGWAAAHHDHHHYDDHHVHVSHPAWTPGRTAEVCMSLHPRLQQRPPNPDRLAHALSRPLLLDPNAPTRSARSLPGMRETTTIKVSVHTRDALRELADREGITLDAQLDRLIRRERRRVIGAQVAGAPLDEDTRAVLDASVSDVADASR